MSYGVNLSLRFSKVHVESLSGHEHHHNEADEE